MRRSLIILVALGAALALSMPGFAASNASDGEAETFVVLFEEGASTADGVAAIEAAGGEVVAVNEAVGLATVTVAEPENFVTEVSAEDAVFGAATNEAIGTTRPDERKDDDERLQSERDSQTSGDSEHRSRRGEEPLAGLQWDMEMIDATADGSYDEQQGKKQVLVGIIDTGIDGSHPDIARNFSKKLSRNFTTDIPEIDGDCAAEADASCEDAANVDENGHGTHVAGTVAAPINRLGTAGVAPKVTLVNLRAGQDSGFFFLPAVVDALTYAGDKGVDVVNMSFYTDPWLYNCPCASDSVPAPTAVELIEMQTIIQAHLRAMEYAHDRGVTLVGSLGNSHIDLCAPSKFDNTSPDFPLGSEVPRTVDNDCVDLPVEGPHVIGVSALGPSTAKADYSNYGVEQITVSAPGGYFRDGFGTPAFQTVNNLVLAPYPENVGIELGDIDENGEPTNDFVVKDCKGDTCAYYQYLQGTSMAAPHVTGVVALIISEDGRNGRRGFGMDPRRVVRALTRAATETECPTPNPFSYENVGRPAEYTAFCEGDEDFNGFYGNGIVNAEEAVD
jgi:lantibiotic leader peptide-processing serine protease